MALASKILALALALKRTGFGLGLEHAVLEPIPGFMSIKHVREIPTGSLKGAKYKWGIKIARFSTNKSLYLAKDAR